MNYILFFIVMQFALMSCGTHSYRKKADMTSLCIFNPDDKKCWINKSEDRGIEFSDMKSFYCLSNEDFRAIITELFEAKTK